MTSIPVYATVDAMLNALQGLADRRGCEFRDLTGSDEIEIDGSVDSDDIRGKAINMGYVHEDDAPDGLDPNLNDLADGLRELIAGNRAMASILLTRALDAWPSAARVIEDTLNNRTVHDRRQLSLLAA